jgi:hypothetical protein
MRFQVAGGSVPGTEHTKPGKPGWTNNHDAFCWRESSDSIVAVVCDGCGSGEHSEVGAKISARIFTHFLSEEADRYVKQTSQNPERNIEFGWERIKSVVLGQISVLASAMGESFSRTINDYFLFTVVGAVITKRDTFLFSIGDGVFIVNGRVVQLGPFLNNAPPYLAYNLTGSSLTDSQPEFLNIRVEPTIPTYQIQSLVIGSDGVLDLINAEGRRLPRREDIVGNISQFWLNDLYFENSDATRRRLAIINREGAEIVFGNSAVVTGGLLPDDTTLIAIRRNDQEEGGE